MVPCYISYLALRLLVPFQLLNHTKQISPWFQSSSFCIEILLLVSKMSYMNRLCNENVWSLPPPQRIRMHGNATFSKSLWTASHWHAHNMMAVVIISCKWAKRARGFRSPLPRSSNFPQNVWKTQLIPNWDHWLSLITNRDSVEDNYLAKLLKSTQTPPQNGGKIRNEEGTRK